MEKQKRKKNRVLNLFLDIKKNGVDPHIFKASPEDLRRGNVREILVSEVLEELKNRGIIVDFLPTTHFS